MVANKTSFLGLGDGYQWESKCLICASPGFNTYHNIARYSPGGS